MRFRVILEGRLVCSTGQIDDAARGALAETFAELNGLGSAAGNAAIHLTSSTGEIALSCTVDATDAAEAVEKAGDNMYLSFYKAGIGTPRKPSRHESCWTVEISETSAKQLAAV